MNINSGEWNLLSYFIAKKQDGSPKYKRKLGFTSWEYLANRSYWAFCYLPQTRKGKLVEYLFHMTIHSRPALCLHFLNDLQRFKIGENSQGRLCIFPFLKSSDHMAFCHCDVASSTPHGAAVVPPRKPRISPVVSLLLTEKRNVK